MKLHSTVAAAMQTIEVEPFLDPHVVGIVALCGLEVPCRVDLERQLPTRCDVGDPTRHAITRR